MKTETGEKVRAITVVHDNYKLLTKYLTSALEKVVFLSFNEGFDKSYVSFLRECLGSTREAPNPRPWLRLNRWH